MQCRNAIERGMCTCRAQNARVSEVEHERLNGEAQREEWQRRRKE